MTRQEAIEIDFTCWAKGRELCPYCEQYSEKLELKDRTLYVHKKVRDYIGWAITDECQRMEDGTWFTVRAGRREKGKKSFD